MAKNFTLSTDQSFIIPAREDLKGKSNVDLYSPSDAAIANILSFSRALVVEKSPVMGHVEIVLN